MIDFATKLANIMVVETVSQSELARRSGVPQTTISAYLRRATKPSWAHVQSLSKALGVSCDALTDDPPEPVAPPPAPRPKAMGKRK